MTLQVNKEVILHLDTYLMVGHYYARLQRTWRQTPQETLIELT